MELDQANFRQNASISAYKH